MKLFGGIDPGASGAIVIIDENKEIIFKSIVPRIGTEYDERAVLEILRRFLFTHVVLEDVHAVQIAGNSGSFSFGESKMMWKMGLVACDIPYTLVQPKKWQTVWDGVPKQYLPTSKKNKAGETVMKVDTKKTSLLAAQRLFPKVDLRKSSRAENPHDGIVDALLMAEYCRRTFK